MIGMTSTWTTNTWAAATSGMSRTWGSGSWASSSAPRTRWPRPPPASPSTTPAATSATRTRTTTRIAGTLGRRWIATPPVGRAARPRSWRRARTSSTTGLHGPARTSPGLAGALLGSPARARGAAVQRATATTHMARSMTREAVGKIMPCLHAPKRESLQLQALPTGAPMVRTAALTSGPWTLVEAGRRRYCKVRNSSPELRQFRNRPPARAALRLRPPECRAARSRSEALTLVEIHATEAWIGSTALLRTSSAPAPRS
mmetsp:Transcript_176681/g.566580  ORF Transcript_176681/g.566580 Transcript_176681/m.566580 type:complete len:259 (-) Transcript_176681:1791-2567(-)